MEDLNFTPEEMLAIMKTISTKEVETAKSAIANDSQAEIDMTVRIKGLLKRGNAFSSKGTSRIPWKVAIALLLKRSGVTGPGSIELLTEAIRDAASMNKDAREKLLSEAGVGDALQVVNKELCEKIPRIQKNGNITFVPQMRQAIHAPVLVTDEDEHNASEVEAAK
tara:strand:- start:64 stop:561 length:498 start_codon:yes stop_codon:yes gene_type:complete